MWAENIEPKLFDHLLAQQMACNHSIDLVDNIKLIPNPSLNINFSRNIVIEAKQKASKKAKKYRAGHVI